MQASEAPACLTMLVTDSLAARKTLWRASGEIWAAGSCGGGFQPVTQAGHREIFLGVFANVVDQSFQRVVGGVDRPDDFVQGAGGFAGGLGDLPGVGGDFGGVLLVALHHFAQEGELGQAGAHLVVDVAGDAGAVFFQGLLLAETGELPLQFLGGNEINQGDDARQKRARHRRAEGRGLPEGRQDGDLQPGGGRVPNSVFVAGLDLEVVGSRRQFAVLGGAALAGVGPIGFVSSHQGSGSGLVAGHPG